MFWFRNNPETDFGVKMSILEIIVYSLMIIGIIGVMFIIAFPFVWLYWKWKIKRMVKNIPDTIKKEVEKNEIQKAEEYREEYREERRRWDDNTERIRRELGYLKPADTTLPISRRGNLQKLSSETSPRTERDTKRNWKQFS